MKIVQINCVYNSGSTGKITKDLHEAFMFAGHDSFVLYGRGSKIKDERIYKVCHEYYSHINKLWSRISGLMYGGCFFSTNKTINLIKKIKPDIVHIQCINGYFINIPRLIKWLKKNDFATVITLHAEFMFTGNCGYAFECDRWKYGCGHCPRLKDEIKSLIFDRTHQSWLKMKKSLDNFKNSFVVSVSPWLMERAKQSPILKQLNHCVIKNGVDETVFYYRQTIPDSMKNIKIGTDSKKVLYVTPNFNKDINHNKGGFYLLALAKIMPNIVFFVAGHVNASESLDAPKNVIFLGNVKDQQELSKLYSICDITLLLSKRETYSMVVAESMCCGTPIVGFLSGGPESIAIEEYSLFVEYGNIGALKEAILLFIAKKHNKRKMSENAINHYSKGGMCSKYLSVYNELKKGAEK